MSEYEERVDRLEAEADQLEQRNEQLDEDIAEAKDKVEAIRQDETVPSADPAPESGLPPEANYTTRGDQPPEGPGDDE
jgi:phage shock protein A